MKFRNPAALIAVILLFGAMRTDAQNRIEFHGQDLFLSGINLAWQHFADDIGPNPATPDLAHFSSVFGQVRSSGGNSLRLWLHTTGAYSPAWTGSFVTGPGADTIDDLRSILDTAWESQIGVVLCLWSFDMLRISNGTNITWRARDILTNDTLRHIYITNALIPIVHGVKEHPAIIAWEIFNEPEGMSHEFGWAGIEHVPMADIQAFVNQCAGAIHRTDPKAKVTSGAWSFYALTDVGEGNTNYYTDARLINAGSDTNGYLDFYCVHYYDWMGTERSPFQHPYSYWELDKPLVVAEFGPPPDGCSNCGSAPYETLYQNGYAGALTWSWTDSDHADMLSAIESFYAVHSADVLLFPELKIFFAAADAAVVYWLLPAAGWNLEHIGDLSDTNWTTIPPEALYDDGVHKYLVDTPTETNRFYRLFKPL